MPRKAIQSARDNFQSLFTVEQFHQTHVGMSTSHNCWRRLFMTGDANTPLILKAWNVAAMAPGAIAVVDKAMSDGLTVLVTGK